MTKCVERAVKGGSRNKKIAKLDPTPYALRVNQEQLSQRSLGCLVVIGKSLDGSLFLKERDNSLPPCRLLLGNFRREDRSCPSRVQISQPYAGRTDRGGDIRPEENPSSTPLRKLVSHSASLPLSSTITGTTSSITVSDSMLANGSRRALWSPRSIRSSTNAWRSVNQCAGHRAVLTCCSRPAPACSTAISIDLSTVAISGHSPSEPVTLPPLCDGLRGVLVDGALNHLLSTGLAKLAPFRCALTGNAQISKWASPEAWGLPHVGDIVMG